MYYWYVSVITAEGCVKTKKVKASNKADAIKKGCKALNSNRLKDCKLCKDF